MEAPLTAQRGDPAAGRALVANRQSLCLLCHTAPIAEERFQGNLAPPLAGVGSRLSVAELRQRIVDSNVINPESIMPPYFRAEGLHHVSVAQRGRTIFTAQQVEDVVEYLRGLR
jgi:sulfur-oxidizing protein SoxX